MSNCYKIKAIVLKKTKLSEADLILTLLALDGSQVRVVAKGGRKPSSTLSSRLELTNNVELLLARGRTLDIVREVSVIKSFNKIRDDIDRFAAVSPALELLYKSSQQNLEVDNLYNLTLKFLDVINHSSNKYYYPAICGAHLIKTCTYLGFRPQMTSCVVCGTDMTNVLCDVELPLTFSYLDGGLICRNCSRNNSAEKLSADVANLIHNLLHTKLEDIVLMDIKESTIIGMLKYCKL